MNLIDCISYYLQGCHIEKNNFEKWLFNLSILIEHTKSLSMIEPAIVFCHLDGSEISRMTAPEFLSEVRDLINKMRSEPSDYYSFPITHIEINSKDFKCVKSIKKPSNKSDIHVVLHDSRPQRSQMLEIFNTHQLKEDNYLIKSGRETINFTYSVEGFTDDMICEFNSLDIFQKKFNLIAKQLNSTKLIGADSKMLKNNLIMIDSCLPSIIGDCLLYHYSGKAHTFEEIEEKLKENNPLNFNIETHPQIYGYKLKHFLSTFALGMTVNKTWDGKYTANGGWLVIKEDGEIVCFQLFNQSEFENYLFKNTYFDTPSLEEINYGNIYHSGSKYLLKLNLQVKFIQ